MKTWAQRKAMRNLGVTRSDYTSTIDGIWWVLRLEEDDTFVREYKIERDGSVTRMTRDLDTVGWVEED